MHALLRSVSPGCHGLECIRASDQLALRNHRPGAYSSCGVMTRVASVCRRLRSPRRSHQLRRRQSSPPPPHRVRRAPPNPSRQGGAAQIRRAPGRTPIAAQRRRRLFANSLVPLVDRDDHGNERVTPSASMTIVARTASLISHLRSHRRSRRAAADRRRRSRRHRRPIRHRRSRRRSCPQRGRRPRRPAQPGRHALGELRRTPTCDGGARSRNRFMTTIAVIIATTAHRDDAPTEQLCHS